MTEHGTDAPNLARRRRRLALVGGAPDVPTRIRGHTWDSSNGSCATTDLRLGEARPPRRRHLSRFSPAAAEKPGGHPAVSLGVGGCRLAAGLHRPRAVGAHGSLR